MEHDGVVVVVGLDNDIVVVVDRHALGGTEGTMHPLAAAAAWWDVDVGGGIPAVAKDHYRGTTNEDTANTAAADDDDIVEVLDSEWTTDDDDDADGIVDDAPTMMTLETVVHREIRYGSLPNHRLPLVDVVAVRGRARRALLHYHQLRRSSSLSSMEEGLRQQQCYDY